MEYLGLLSCCCRDGMPSLTLKCKSNCCRSQSYEINITDEDDIEKILKMFADLQAKQEKSKLKNR
jgi:hypothetical protein